ncbi:unnamed protein product [Clonostachys chloroleuca]|uniref:BZIP domain-containing protein n=1 Tax=Clonostachys chloroleuca TaxID=1926264 RepID=A0AA35MBA5_9HYPO|nr:unnamed protein product [Clonostachys chloroleuca]
MGSAEAELERRRERGRRAQAAFRQRKAKLSNELEERNLQLIQGIERLVSVATGEERPEVLAAINYLADAAGLDTKVPLRHQQQTPTDSEKDESSHSEILKEDVVFDLATRGTVQNRYQEIASPSTPSRLDCGMWVDPAHYMRVSLPPEDIIPYIGSGADTFAGRLFWSVMEHSQSGCTGRHVHPRLSDLMSKAVDHCKVTQEVNLSFVKAMAQARLEFKNTGSISPKNAAAGEPDLGMVICERIKRDYLERGKNPDVWLPSVAIEAHLRRRIDDPAAFRLLEDAARGEGDPTLRTLLENIQCRLFDNTICFGDGPRWHVDVVDCLFLEWMERTSVLRF